MGKHSLRPATLEPFGFGMWRQANGQRLARGLANEERPEAYSKGGQDRGALGRFRDTVEAGVPIEQRYTVRRARLNLTPRTFGPDEIKGVRVALGVSQPIFGQFLGVDVKTIRSWEQGQRLPSGIACRFLEEIQTDLGHWRGSLREVLIIQDVDR
jgi:putative transcriptional regulator